MSGQAAFDKVVRPAALCRGETTENRKAGRNEETELNGVEEERDEGDEIDGARRSKTRKRRLGKKKTEWRNNGQRMKSWRRLWKKKEGREIIGGGCHAKSTGVGSA